MRAFPSLPVALVALACVSEHGPLTNRMAQSSTRYLTRAAGQPVSWQPWGREAFALAARLDRPVLLYVGADDCRSCAAMDREVYEDAALGSMIDSLFVPVRVDRDERPDVAERYEAAVRWLAGLSGYPVTAFLTPDGSAFFGGTYFPADDPVTGRGLKQILPEVAKSYRERRAFILQHAALVRELTRTRDAQARSVLRPAAIEAEVNAVRASLRLAVASRSALGSFTHTQAVSLMLVTYRRTRDSSYLDAARAALDLMVDSGDSTDADGARDEPPALVRAGLVRALTPAWALTGEARYGAALLALLNRLTRDVGRTTFADQEAYVLESVLDGPPGLGASAAARALSALDALLRRAYAPGRGARHSATVGPGVLLQDQVQLAGACLAAYRRTGERRYLLVAEDLAAVLDRAFADSAVGGYFDSATGDPTALALPDRAKPVLDGLLPGGNASAAQVLLELAEATGDARYRQRAEATLEALAGAVSREGTRAASYLAAAEQALDAHGHDWLQRR